MCLSEIGTGQNHSFQIATEKLHFAKAALSELGEPQHESIEPGPSELNLREIRTVDFGRD